VTERTRLRNQFRAGLVFGILTLVKLFWIPGRISTESKDVWAMRVFFAVAAFVFFHLAWTKYWEYREKYPRNT
jgi:hypothetical protein